MQRSCLIGSLALELHEPDPAVRELLARNFESWVRAVRCCLEDARDRLPAGRNTRELAEFVLTTMEGAVMQARTHRDIRYFDGSVRQLRAYFDLLLQAKPAPERKKKASRKKRTTQ